MPRILLVDDDVGLCELLTEYLSLEGFDIHAVGDGETALLTLQQTQYDALLLDVSLPGLSGLDVLREVLRCRSIPILMLTARGDDIDRIIGLEMGADDYIPKPCNPREIVARLRAVLRRTRQKQQEVDKKMLTITIRDYGSGVPNSALAHLFEPFYRVGQSQQFNAGGFGIGLAMSKRIIELHGGSINAKNLDGKGFLVSTFLPISHTD